MSTNRPFLSQVKPLPFFGMALVAWAAVTLLSRFVISRDSSAGRDAAENLLLLCALSLGIGFAFGINRLRTVVNKNRKLRGRVERHLRIDLPDAHSVARDIRSIERVNIQNVIDAWMQESRPSASLFGYSNADTFLGKGLVQRLIANQLVQAPIERTQVECAPGEQLDCVQQGIFLVHRDGSPIVVAISPPSFSMEAPSLEIIAPTREAAGKAMSDMSAEIQRVSVYRGRVVTLEAQDQWRRAVGLSFCHVKATSRDDIVLPDDLIDVVERNVFGMEQHAGVLRAAGLSLRRGLLLHGPPGTGKTMMVRYLATATKSLTTVLVSGIRDGIIKEACQIARMLAPCLIVLEDVDLIAQERQKNQFPMLLHELLDEMDGIGAQEGVTFLLTTNRPEVIEEALSNRPGRIDLAIGFPLPDSANRRKLFDVYGRGMDLSDVDVDRWVAKTKGVSPAFLAELLRKAALTAADRGETSQPLRLTDDDIDRAMQELTFFGGELTKRLVGYRLGALGSQHDPRD